MDKMKAAEVVVLGGVLAVTLMAPLNANATLVSSTPSAQTQSISASAANGYVVTGFNLNMSANVSLGYDGNTTQVAVQTANAKGMHTFGGSSQGGSVAACQTASVSTPVATSPSPTGTGCN